MGRGWSKELLHGASRAGIGCVGAAQAPCKEALPMAAENSKTDAHLPCPSCQA